MEKPSADLEKKSLSDHEDKKERLIMSSRYDRVIFITNLTVTLAALSRTFSKWNDELQKEETMVEMYWRKFDYLCNGDPFYMAVIGVNVSLWIGFWSVGGIHTIMDVTGKPASLMKYRIKDDPNTFPVNPQLMLKCIKRVLFNTLLTIPYSIIIAGHLKMQFTMPMDNSLVYIFYILLDLAGLEISFYYIHWLLHRPFLYKNIHKIHHEWKNTTSICLFYTHPYEHIFGNFLPVMCGVFVMPQHAFTAFSWLVYSTAMAVYEHSGYHFPLLPSNEFHNFHHNTTHYTFAFLGYMDQLHGTDDKFKASPINDRHFMFKGLEPIHRTNKVSDTKN